MPVNRVKRNGSYAPLSAHYYKDDAIDEAGEAAELLYVRGLAFCADVLSDGFISDRQLVRFVGVGMFDAKERADRLVDVELWDRVQDGYRVRSWLDWNRSREEITDFQKKDADRKRPAGRKDSGEPPATPPGGGRMDSERNPDGVHTDSGSLSSAPARARSTKLHSSPTSSADADAPAEKTLDDWFAEYWTTWPRKIAKAAAFTKYRTAVRKGATPQHINDRAAAQVAVWQAVGKDKQFIPHPATWLGQGRYDDELDNPNQTVLSVVPDLPATFDDIRAQADLEQMTRLLGRSFHPAPQPPSDRTPPAQWRRDRAVELIDAHEAELRDVLGSRRAG